MYLTVKEGQSVTLGKWTEIPEWAENFHVNRPLENTLGMLSTSSIKLMEGRTGMKLVFCNILI